MLYPLRTHTTVRFEAGLSEISVELWDLGEKSTYLALCTDTNSVANLDVLLHVLANTNSLANNLVAN